MTGLPKAQEQPISLTTPFSAPWLRSLRSALGSENGRPVLMGRMRLADYQTRHIAAEINRLRGLLSPSSDRTGMAVELARLLAAFPSQQQSDTPAELRMAAYFEALEGVPAWAVGEARARILRGEVVLDHRFCPTPPELANVVRIVLRPLRADLDDLRKIQAAATGDHTPTEAEKRRVSEGFQRLRADLTGTVN